MSRRIRRNGRASALLLFGCLSLGGALAAPATVGAESFAIRLSVEPTKVKKNGTAKLTAVVKPAETCASRAVLFQVKHGSGWDKVGKKTQVDRSCSVSQKVKIDSKSVFRALLIDPKKSRTLVTSPGVTVTPR